MNNLYVFAEELSPQPSLQKRFQHEFPHLKGVVSQRIARVETSRALSEEEQKLAHELLLSSFGHKVSSAQHLHLKLFEIAYQPAISDPEHPAIQKILKTTDFFKDIQAVKLSTVYGFEGLVEAEARKLTHTYLFNELLHVIIPEQQQPATLTITAKPEPTEIITGFAKMSLEELRALSDERSLYMEDWSLLEVQRYFRDELKRDPTDSEIEYLAQRTSDHCFHTTWKSLGLFKKLKIEVEKVLKKRKDIVSVFVDNAGVMALTSSPTLLLGKRREKNEVTYLIKGETHNSPTAIAPVGGVETMHGGCIRDILGTGQGGFPTMASEVFIVGTQSKEEMGKEYEVGSFLDPLVILRGMIQGVQNYGNAMGIPNFCGRVLLHPKFFGKPLALGVCVGTGEKKFSKKGKPKKGDIALLIGSPTGRDGIHGATMSSAANTETMIKKEGATVQIGDPYTERLIMEATPELRPLLRAYGDLGAGGIASCFGEMGEGVGIELDLTNIPTKYEGLSAWEKLESESQERMGAAVSPDNLERVMAILKRHEVPSCVIGKFTGKKQFVVHHGQEKIVDLPYAWLEDFPVPEKKINPHFSAHEKIHLTFPPLARGLGGLCDTLLSLLSQPNLADQSLFLRRWDSTVQGKSFRESLMPFTNMPYDQGITVQRNEIASSAPHQKPTPAPRNDITQVLSLTINPWWAGNPSNMARACVAGSVSKQIAAGVKRNKIVLCDNFYTPKSRPEIDFQLTEMVRVITDMMLELETPIISGKDSSSGTTKMRPIPSSPSPAKERGLGGEVLEVPPTLCMTAMGMGEDLKKIPPKEFQKAGNQLYFIPAGISNDASGSALLAPEERMKAFNYTIDIAEYRTTIDALSELIQEGKIKAISVVDEGGIFHRLFEMMVGSGLGVELNTRTRSIASLQEFLTNTLPGSFIVEVEPGVGTRLIASSLGGILLGEVIKEPEMHIGSDVLKLENMKKVWQEAWYKILKIPREHHPVELPKRFTKFKTSQLQKRTVYVVYTPGINCHQEMLRAWQLLGCDVKLVSVTDPQAKFANSEIVVFPGGFADGDYLSAAKVWHRVMETQFKDQMDYLRSGKIPVLGICNGFQLMTRSGFFGGSLRLTFNESGVFEQRWVKVKLSEASRNSIWTKGLEGQSFSFPVAHGEGRFVMDGAMTKATIGMTYDPNVYPNNPNGSVHAIAGVFSGSHGQFFGVMPHPERAIESFHMNQDGLLLFENILKNLT